MNASEVEHRYVILGVEFYRLFISCDRLRRTSSIAVRHAQLEPTHSIGLKVLRLLEEDWATLFKATEEIERGA